MTRAWFTSHLWSILNLAFSTPTHSDSSAAGYSAILKQPLSPASAFETGTAGRINQGFERLIQQSGSHFSGQQWLFACCCLAAILGVTAFAATSHLLLTAAAVTFGAAAPLAVASAFRKSRQSKIMEQLPAVAKSISRNSIAGQNFETALQHTASQTPAPLGDELQQAVNEIRLGIMPARAIGELGHRTGVAELAMFSSAVTIHQNQGGNLATMLERFAVAVQDRLHFESRVRAATIATRLGTLLMLGLPPCIVVYYSFQDETYLTRLLSSSIGRLSVAVAVGLQVTGAISVYRILKQSTRQ